MTSVLAADRVERGRVHFALRQRGAQCPGAGPPRGSGGRRASAGARADRRPARWHGPAGAPDARPPVRGSPRRAAAPSRRGIDADRAARPALEHGAPRPSKEAWPVAISSPCAQRSSQVAPCSAICGSQNTIRRARGARRRRPRRARRNTPRHGPRPRPRAADRDRARHRPGSRPASRRVQPPLGQVRPGVPPRAARRARRAPDRRGSAAGPWRRAPRRPRRAPVRASLAPS
jgi:hypothetical protein